MATPLAAPFQHIRHLGLRCRGVIHVGANAGQEVEEYAAFGLRHALLIEPQDEPFRQLQAAVEGQKHYHAIQSLCLATDDAEVSFYPASNSLSSSILPPNVHLAVYANIAFAPPHAMRGLSLDTLRSRFLTKHPKFTPGHFDVLVIDVQGAELSVLAGARQTLATMKAVICEVSHTELYEGGAKFEDVQHALEAYGFKLFWAGLNRKLYGDALFVHPEQI